MLADRYTLQQLSEAMLPSSSWRLFPAATDRASWETLRQQPLNAARAADVIARAETLLGQPWPAVPAVRYMDYGRDGNRSRYESYHLERRERLTLFALAESFEHRGRFLDEIINGIWCICEETTWVIPAHAKPGTAGLLPDLDRYHQRVDLYACRTAMTLACVYHLLQQELDAVSPLVCQRLVQQVEEQVLRPIEERDDLRWFDGHNNWTTWCCSTSLIAAMCLWDDPHRLARYAHKMMRLTDRFIAGYGDDGGCDEGPGYWNAAGGLLGVILELLYTRTSGLVDLWQEPKIRAMAEYPAKAHLDGPWSTNFADAPARTTLFEGPAYRFGERIGSDALCEYVLCYMHGWGTASQADPAIRPGIGALFIELTRMWWIPADASPRGVPPAISHWLPDIQVAVMRQLPQADKGLALACKGGHNAESHNHNDIGHFILTLDGQPGIIDLGSERYTRETFGPRRYERLCMRSSGHNVPVVNGCEQLPGEQYAAREVSFQDDGRVAVFSADLAAAYGPAAGLGRLQRTITLNRQAAAVTVCDELNTPARTFELNLYTLSKPSLLEPGRVGIATAPRMLVLSYDASLLEANITRVPLTDEWLVRSWGSEIWQLVLSGESIRTALLSFSVENRVYAP